MDTIKLSSGVEMPVIGLGTYKSSPREAYKAVLWAISAGYRHIDTAAFYQNEEDVGRAISESGVPRKEIFITTKLWPDSYSRAEEGFEESRSKLGVDKIDLYLLHWPQSGWQEAWERLKRIKMSGKAREIGVCNFTVRHLKEMKGLPVINQFECNPFLSQEALRAYCKEKGIVVEAYTPLTRAEKLSHPKITEIAEKLGKTPAQVMLAWGLQKGNVVIPKSVHHDRIISNLDVSLTLDDEDMKRLDSLDEGFRMAPDPEDM